MTESGMSIPPRESYEGTGGWADGRLGQAYDLISAARDELDAGSGARQDLLGLLSKIDGADCRIKAERS